MRLQARFMIACMAVVPFAAQGTIPETRIAKLASVASAKGEIRVIIQLDVTHVPEGRLNSAAVVQQRQTIASRQQAVASQVRGSGAREIRRFRYIPFSVFTANANGIRALGRLPGVEGMEEVVAERPALEQTTQIVGAPAAWTQGYDGSGQVIAVLDTGVDYSHPFFGSPGKLVAEACFSTGEEGSLYESLCPDGENSSLAPGSGSACPLNIAKCDHGTHVAGIAVGDDGVGPNFGVARGAKLISIQVFSNAVCQAKCDTYAGEAVSFPPDQIAALEQVYDWRHDFSIAAVNMSLGGFARTSVEECEGIIDNAARKAAAENLRSVGIAVIAASGNFGRRDAMYQPACISNFISVGAVTNQDEVWSFSNVANFIDFLAPGVNVTSAARGGGVKDISGTSMATPHVAGAWAILRQAGPAASVDDILFVLQSTGVLVDDTRSGGIVTDMARIDIASALTETVGQFPETIFINGFEE